MKNKFSHITFLLAALSIILFACEEGPNFIDYSNYYPEPTVTGINPTASYPGLNVTITGTNLDTLTGAAKVWFGGIQATNIVSSNGTELVVQVPADAVSGKVTLQVWTHTIDSIGSYTVIPAPVISSVASSSSLGSNIALPGDTITLSGSGFGTDASILSIKISGSEATILSPVTDNTVKVLAPDEFGTGEVTLTINGLTLTGAPAIINPTAPGDITRYFLSNTGVVDGNGGGFARSDDGGRWGKLAEPWVTNDAGLNKGDDIGGWGKEQWNGREGYICWETWGNTPIVDGIIYQPTSMALPAGSYTVTINYYSEVQTNSSAYLEVATGGDGIPVLADISTAMASVALYNGATVGDTKPSYGGEASLDFTLETSQVVSIGFLGNMAGADSKACYLLVKWIKLVKN